MLQRYSIKHDLDNTEENDRGGWVLYEDVRQRIAELEQCVAKLKEQNRQMKQHIADVESASARQLFRIGTMAGGKAELTAALEDSRSKRNLLEKTLYAENQALREQNRRLVDVLKAVLDWAVHTRDAQNHRKSLLTAERELKAALDAAEGEGEGHAR